MGAVPYFMRNPALDAPETMAPPQTPIQMAVNPTHAMTAPLGPPMDQQINMAQAMTPEVPPVGDPGTMSGKQPSGSGPPKKMSPLDQQEDKAQLRLMADYQKDENPYGSENNHPGFFGKLLHGLSHATGGDTRRQWEEQGLQKQVQGLEAEKSKEGLEGAQTTHEDAATEALKNPADKFSTLDTDQGEMRFDPKTGDVQPLQGANGQTLQAPGKQATPIIHESDQGIFLVDPMSGKVTQLTNNGQPLMPKQKSVNTKEDLQAQIADALERGDTAKVKTLQDRMKAIDPEGQQRLQVTIQGQNNANQRAEANVSRQDVRAHDKAYVQPAESIEKSYDMMDNAYKEYKAAAAKGQELPTGAQSMLALSTHLATTFGNVKGARVTKDMIAEHLGARSISDDALVAMQKFTNGDRLSPDQWNAFHGLIKQSRDLTWSTAVKEAARKHIPIDFLPPDLQTVNKGGHNYEMGEDGQYHLKGAQ